MSKNPKEDTVRKALMGKIVEEVLYLRDPDTHIGQHYEPNGYSVYIKMSDGTEITFESDYTEITIKATKKTKETTQ